MKLAILALAALTVVGCASKQTAPVVEQSATSVAVPAQNRSNTGAPDWFVRVPESTETVVFATGTATSSDEQMAYDKARLFAERKLVESAHAVITTQTKSFQNDTGTDVQARFETITRRNAQGQVVGVQQVDSQATFDGRHYRVYVLVRLPLGESNTQQAAQDRAQSQREAEFRARRAEQEMDRNQTQLQNNQRQQDLQMQRDLGPASLAPNESFALPEDATPIPVQRVESVQLLDVDNEEYRRRRDAVLQQPGAVIGHITVR
jgi:hypothetical protein